MTATLIYVAVGVAAALGLGVAVWSYIDTRQKYYSEYIKRRSK